MTTYFVTYIATHVMGDEEPVDNSAFIEADDPLNAAASAQFLIGDSYQLEIIGVTDDLSTTTNLV